MPKILCIDDNAHGLAIRRVLLEGMGHKVSVALNGREGLEMFRRERPDIVIVDYVMPQMNGAEVVQEIKRVAPMIPIILLSAFTETWSLEEKVKDADCVLCKGNREIPELKSAVTRLLRKSMRKPAASVTAKAKAKQEPAKERKTASRKSRS